jgi:pyruvate dehydrogenase E1 component
MGAMSSWVAAATSYSTNDLPMVPFYIYYSMFGFQRVGDMAWLAGDQQARGFLLGATAGRTTLNGEGLQHEDGHSHVLASTIPNCIAYDPTFSFELAVILQDGLRRMYGPDQENVFYYLTLMNENYHQPAMPDGVEEGIRRGIYKLLSHDGEKAKVQLLGSGTILNEVIKAAEILSQEYQIASDVYSVTSFNELARDGQDVSRYNMLHPEVEPRSAYVTDVMGEEPAIASTDYIKNHAEQIRPYLPGSSYKVLGTDGFGRSDSRPNLRRHFEVNAEYVVVAALHELSKRGDVEKNLVSKAIEKFGIDVEITNPLFA